MDSKNLTPGEIRFLSKIDGKPVKSPNLPGYFEYKYGYDVTAVINDLTSSGYLKIGNPRENVENSDMQTLRYLLKERGLKAGGKKQELIQRVLENYTNEELENVPAHYVATDLGKRVLEENRVLLFYFNALYSTNCLEIERIVEAQKGYSGDEINLLISLLKEKEAANPDDISPKFGLVILCRMTKEGNLLEEKEREITEYLEAKQKEQEELSKKYDEIRGISREEMERIRQKALAEMDDDWEKELNEQAKRRAGII